MILLHCIQLGLLEICNRLIADSYKEMEGKRCEADERALVIILMAYCSNPNWFWITLLVLQHLFFLAGRAFDDVSWYNVGIYVGTLETFSLVFIAASMLIKIARKYFY